MTRDRPVPVNSSVMTIFRSVLGMIQKKQIQRTAINVAEQAFGGSMQRSPPGPRRGLRAANAPMTWPSSGQQWTAVRLITWPGISW